MDCIILQNTYCACMDMSIQLRTLLPDIQIAYIAEEALQIVHWLTQTDSHPDCIIADTEACDGDTIDIFRHAGIQIPLILTCSSPDEVANCSGLNVAGTILKPVSLKGLRTMLPAIYNYCSL
ncbi:MAG: hypothetical protein K2K26_06745 [Muribaculaceae bacterium]|nr:hypothetical protein [Muribaculaceae bacterium]